MKVTIAPETEAEKKTTKGATYVGLASLAVIGITYEGDVIRTPMSYAYTGTDIHELRRELPVLDYHLILHQLRKDTADFGRLAAGPYRPAGPTVPEMRTPDNGR